MINLILTTALIKPWSLIPILFVLLAFLLTIFAIYAGKHFIKSDKVFNIIIFVFGILFVGMEITHEIGRYKYFGHYDWSSFPFQFCSVSMYLALITPFINKKAIRKPLLMFFGLFTLLGGLLPLIFAQGNLVRWDKIGGIIFSFSWHILLMVMAGLAIGHAKIGTSFKEEKMILLQTLMIFFIITCVAQFLNFSIHMFAHPWDKPLEGFKEVGYLPNYELDPDSCSLFYISPFFKSNIPVIFDKVWVNFGWIICWGFYLFLFSFGAILVYGIIYLLKRLIQFICKDEIIFE